MGQTTIKQRQIAGGLDGWIPAEETWTYASADDPTFTFTISGDLSSKYSAGMRIKLTQTTVKYFIITKVAYSSPNTTITVYGGTDYDLANAAITSPYYSMVKAPQGFPLSPAKWTEEYKNTSLASQSSPTAATWYNIGGSLSVPIGVWNLEYRANVTGEASSGNIILLSSLSNANNTAAYNQFTNRTYIVGSETNIGYVHSASGVMEVASKTTFYINATVEGTSVTGIYCLGNFGTPRLIRATCAYL